MFNFLCAEKGDTNIWLMVGLIALLVVMFAVMMIPQRRNRKKMVDTLNKLQPGDEITTAGGIIGKIIEIDEENMTITLQTGTEENPTTIKIMKNAIYSFNHVARIEEEERARIEAEEKRRMEEDAEIAVEVETKQETKSVEKETTDSSDKN